MKERIREELQAMSEPSFAEFQRKLMPTVPPDTVLGIRTPKLRSYAKALYRAGDLESFLSDVPHQFFEENCLHGFVLEQMKDGASCLDAIDRFLPYVDNWATCDTIRPKCLKKSKPLLLRYIRKWLSSDHVYTIRFGIGMLMVHFLQDDFMPEHFEWVSGANSDEYYVNMMRAWYFATAMIYQYDLVCSYLNMHRLSPWVHNKTIQKAVESFRITPEQKAYLRTIRWKNP